MSDRSAVTNKGKDGKTKYSSLNLYDTYKGKSVEPQKQAVSHGRGLQSLGKVGNARRLPTPANLPSLRSEHKGNDPNINLVPSSGAGWGSEEKKSQDGATAPSTAQTNPTQQSQETPTQEDTQSGKSWHPSAASAPQQGIGNQQGAPVRNVPSRLDQEFPTLGMSGDQAQHAPSSSKDPEKEKEKPKEVQYGPGPSLRPQNVKSWREGGSSLNKSAGTGTGEGEGPASSGAALSKDQSMLPPNIPPAGIMNGAQGTPPPPPGPMHPQFRGMMQSYMQFGPHGMPAGPGGPRGPPPLGAYPMGYPGPGMQGHPPPRHSYHPNAMMPQPGQGRGYAPPRHGGQPEKGASRKDAGSRPAIVNLKHLTDMDSLAGSKTEEGWAGASGEVDYSEKIVFSDEEDDSPKKRDKGLKQTAPEAPKEKEVRKEEDFNGRPPTSDGFPPGQPRAAWDASEREGGPPPPMARGPGPHHGRGPPNIDPPDWNRGSHEHRGPHQPPSHGHFGRRPPQFQRPPPHHPHGSKGHSRQAVDEDDDRWHHQRQKQSNDMLSNIERARQRRMEEERREEERQKAGAAEKLRQLDERTAREQKARDIEPPAHREIQKRDSGHEIHKERERERDLEFRDRDRNRERLRDRDYDPERDRSEMPYSLEGMIGKRQRTESGSSDGSRQGRDRRDGGNFQRQPPRNLPPRFLKQQQQQQQQHQEQHGHQPRRQPSFPPQDQSWHGGRGSWSGNGPTTPTTPPFGQDPRQFNAPSRVHIQRRRENSETSSDGHDRMNYSSEPRDVRDSSREGDIPSGNAAVPTRGEMEERSRGGERGFRGPRGPYDAPPKEIPRRQDSQKELDSHRNQETRQDYGPEHRQEHRPELRQDYRQEYRMEQRQDAGQETLPDRHQEARSDTRPDARPDGRPEAKPDGRLDARPDGRLETRPEPRQDHRQENWQPEHWQGERPPRDRYHSQNEENGVDTRQSAPEKSSTGPNVELKEPEVKAPTQVQEKKEPVEAKGTPQGEKEKKSSVPPPINKDVVEQPKSGKVGSAGGVEKERRPQRDSKSVPSSLVDMKSGNRDKYDRSEKADRYDRGKRRDSDKADIHSKDDKNIRRGSQEQTGPKDASTKPSDGKDGKKMDSQGPEPSRAWKGSDASQRLKLKEPPKADETRNVQQQSEVKETKTEDKQAPPVNISKTKVTEDENKQAMEAKPQKEPKDSNQNDKAERKEKVEVKGNGARSKDAPSDKPKGESRNTHERFSRDKKDERRDDRRDDRKDERDGRERRDEKDVRERGKMGGRSRGSDVNRRRDDRGPPSRRDRGRYDSAPRGRGGFKPYSGGFRGRGRGRGERYDSGRQGYRRPPRDEEEEEWDVSSGDESVERQSDRKDVPKAAKPVEASGVAEGNGHKAQQEEKITTEGEKPKEAEVKEDPKEMEREDPERSKLERRNMPRGEPSRRGRGSSSSGMRGGGRGGRGGSSRGRGRESYSRDEREDRRPPSNRDGSQRHDRGPRGELDGADSREFRGRGREEDGRSRLNKREAQGRGGYKRPRPERPPRFQKTPHGRGRVRTPRGEHGPENPGSRSKDSNEKNPGSSGASADGLLKGAARPPLPRQNSSDLNNDEWETASESSNFNDHKPREKDMPQDAPKPGSDKAGKEPSASNPRSNGNPEGRTRNDRRENSRKSSSNHRQGGEKSGNRDSYRSDYDRRDKGIRSSRENRGPSSRGGRGRGERKSDGGPVGKRSGGPRGGAEQTQNHDVFTVNKIVLNDQRQVTDALAACHNRSKKQPTLGKPLDSATPVTLPMKEKEKPRTAIEKNFNTFATYDINNSYGVVVVDDVPEVIVEDPEELMTPDAGFQPVLSKKQKAAESERKKMETLSELGKKPKLGTPMKQRTNMKLPPRLRGQAASKDSAKEPASASPIGSGLRTNTLNKAPGTKPININTENIAPLMGTPTPGVSMATTAAMRKVGAASVPPPPPTSNAWEKPPLLSASQTQPSAVTTSMASVAMPTSKPAGTEGKPESTSDQHDSGVELNSDHHASNPPSQRSSPNGEGKAENRMVSEYMNAVSQPSKHATSMAAPLTSQPDWSSDMKATSVRLPSVGLQSVAEVAVSSNGQSYMNVGGMEADGLLGRMDQAAAKDDEANMRNLGVDMTQSAGVIGTSAPLGQSTHPHGTPSRHSGQTGMMQSPNLQTDQKWSNVQSPTSTAATDELTIRIESAKNFWDQEESAPPTQPSLSESNRSSQALNSMTTVSSGEQQQQHVQQVDTSREATARGDLAGSHLGHAGNSMLPVSGASGITFGSFPSSDVDLVENDVPTSASFTSLNVNASLSTDEMEASVPSSRGFAQFSTANVPAESPPEVLASTVYSSKGLSLYNMPAVTSDSSFPTATLLQSSMVSHTGYENKHIGGDQQRLHQQQQHQTYQQSVVLAQPFGMSSSLGSGLAGGATALPGSSLGGSIGGSSQSLLSQGASGQYSFQGHDTSRLIPGTPAFLTPASFQGTVIQPQSGSLQFGLNQNTALAPSSPAPGAPQQQTHQSYPQAAATGFVPTQGQPAPPSGLQAGFAPMLSVSLSQPPVQSQTFISLSSPSFTRASHDHGLSSGHTSSVIMKPQTTFGGSLTGLTKTVASVPFGSVSTVPAVQPSHMYGQQRATSQLGAQQPSIMTANTLMAGAMQPTPTPGAAPSHHPAQGQHTSFFSGGAPVAAANSQVGSTNFFNTLQGSRSTGLQASVPAMQQVSIQLPQSTISSQYPLAQPSYQTSQQIIHPIGPMGNAYGDIGTQPKHLTRSIPSGFSHERQSVVDLPSDLLSRSEPLVNRGSNLSQHVDAKPFSPNRQMGSSIAYGSNKPQEDRHSTYTNRIGSHKLYEQSLANKPSGYGAPLGSIGPYTVDDRKMYAQAKLSGSDTQRALSMEASGQQKLALEVSVASASSPSLSAALPYSVASIVSSSGSSSQKPVYTQASTSPPQTSSVSSKSSIAGATPAPALSIPRGVARSGSNNPRMAPQMFSQAGPRMMSPMMGIRYPPPFPPPPRSQFMQQQQPPRAPVSAASVKVPTGQQPPLKTQPPPAPSSHSAPVPKGQQQSQQTGTSSSGPASKSSAGQSGFQSGKKSLQGLPGLSKLTKPPSHFSRRTAPDHKMTPEELKAAQIKDRENLLASTKAFFSNVKSQEAKANNQEAKEKADKSESDK
ncbi:uncharacterized protein [Diadema antillarum]|uniref:uncharacterized protein n=1 Tax=Diadema antillarum TaxID=105358 RepID=UPI003A8834D8